MLPLHLRTAKTYHFLIKYAVYHFTDIYNMFKRYNFASGKQHSVSQWTFNIMRNLYILLTYTHTTTIEGTFWRIELVKVTFWGGKLRLFRLNRGKRVKFTN